MSRTLANNGLIGHESSSGLGVYDRILINNDNIAVGMPAENIVYESNHPVEIVANMLLSVDDSLKSSREHTLDPWHQMVGVSFGGHIFKNYVTVVDFWREYIDNNTMFEMKKGIYNYDDQQSDEEY